MLENVRVFEVPQLGWRWEMWHDSFGYNIAAGFAPTYEVANQIVGALGAYYNANLKSENTAEWVDAPKNFSIDRA